MNVSFHLLPDIEEQVRREGADLNSKAREAYLVELYRQERITQHQLAEALGLSRLEIEAVLKRHRVPRRYAVPSRHVPRDRGRPRGDWTP